MNIRSIGGPALALILAGALLSGGCGEAERLYDCANICDNYADCIDDSLDKGDCTDRCEEQGDADPDFEQQASDCEDCLDDQSCADAAVECTTTCASVVSASI